MASSRCARFRSFDTCKPIYNPRKKLDFFLWPIFSQTHVAGFAIHGQTQGRQDHPRDQSQYAW